MKKPKWAGKERPLETMPGFRHGGYKTGAHRSWRAMRSRCLTKTSVNYKHYGGRGVTICERWSLFENFLEDMGERPEGMSLDRWPNRDGNYEPGNCRWATVGDQLRNRSNSRMFTIDGETLCASDWARRFGIKPVTLYGRLSRGVPFADALRQPSMKASAS